MFHMVFTRNEEARRGLIGAVLNIPVSEIKPVEVLNPIQYSEGFDTKITVLDLKVHLNSSRFVLVEMQVRRFDEWTNRTLVYGCRQVADQAQKDFDYGDLQQVIQVSIMDYTLFPDHRRFFARYEIQDQEGYPYTDKLKFYVMDLTAVSQATEAEKQQGLVEWAEAFRADSLQEVKSIDNSAVKEAAETMEGIMNNPAERELLRMRVDALIDQRTQINSARREGHAEGRMEGTLNALSDLVRDGVLTMAEAARRAGMSIADFSARTGLPILN